MLRLLLNGTSLRLAIPLSGMLNGEVSLVLAAILFEPTIQVDWFPPCLTCTPVQLVNVLLLNPVTLIFTVNRHN